MTNITGIKNYLKLYYVRISLTMFFVQVPLILFSTTSLTLPCRVHFSPFSTHTTISFAPFTRERALHQVRRYHNWR
jgi:hypothetical protein